MRLRAVALALVLAPLFTGCQSTEPPVPPPVATVDSPSLDTAPLLLARLTGLT